MIPNNRQNLESIQLNPMDRIFQIAGEFLESVDQRADRSVNGKDCLYS